MYIYVSNESQDVNLFFDNLTVTHLKGPLVEETHYYPFGLAMAGISSKAAGSLNNRYKFNGGTELSNKEFSDGSRLEWYETSYRGYDAQIGRFNQIDLLAYESYFSSPYVYANNNPILFYDPLGLSADSAGKPTPTNPFDNAKLLQEVVITPNKSVGQPGFGESLIPIWGPGRAAVDDFQKMEDGVGVFLIPHRQFLMFFWSRRLSQQ